MDYNDISRRHIAENINEMYSNPKPFEKARQAEPIGTIKQMGGREVIKTANGWRAHTKGSATRTKEHLEKNPSANHKDEHLHKYSKETPEAELKRVIKESTDPRLREHANKELARRKEEESGKVKTIGKTKSGKDVLQDHADKMKKLLTLDEDNKLDLKGENPYKKGQKVSYETEDRFENKWDEHAKVVSNHPETGHVLLDNGAKMHHTELQKKEHRFKTRK